MNREIRAKIQAALTKEEFAAYQWSLSRMVRDAMEMRSLLNDRVNRDTVNTVRALMGDETIFADAKLIDDLEWDERANAVLGGDDEQTEGGG